MGGAGGIGGQGGTPEQCDDPGRVTIQRLNRFEYNNTIRDLLGDNSHPADAFPEDNIGYGFDNIGDVLSVSTLHIEGYEAAGTQLFERLLDSGTPPQTWAFEAEEVGADVGAASGNGWNIWANGTMTVDVDLPAQGAYVARINAFGQQGGPDVVRMVVALDGVQLEEFEVEAVDGAPETYTVRFDTVAGPHAVAVSFINDFYEPDEGIDRNLIIDWIEVEGPFGAAAADPERRARVMVCEPADDTDLACARTVISGFARRAWRRPVEDDEIDRLMPLVELAIAENDGINTGIELALRAVLLSPNFLYRVELDPDPNSLAPHPLSDHELATRLSYFIWGSMPDDLLFAAADAGLNNLDALEVQTRRMLADPRAEESLVEGFGMQWLQVRTMETIDPDYEIYADFDEELRTSMTEESRLFLQHFMHGSLSEMMDADFTFINERLATHYDLPLVGDPVPNSPGFVRASLAESPRGGLLTLGAVLSVTSFRTRTSPVKRGKWVLDQLLCQPPAPPPAGVVASLADVDPEASLRERLTQHRADPVCASCHDLMDPLGFGMENFDAIGAYREMVGVHPVDASGELPDGRSFNGVAELGGILKEDPQTPKCFTRKMFTYALGRGPVRADTCHLKALTESFKNDGQRIDELIVNLTLSESFRMRRGEEVE